MFTTKIPTPIGETAATSPDGEILSGLWFTGQKYFPDLSDAREKADCHVFVKLHKYLDAYFKGLKPAADFEIIPQGTPFRLKIWERLKRIPYGATATYGEVARALTPSPRGLSCRAAGGAVGRNPVSILIPCHRVIGADGALTGYAGGLDRKRFLLRLEGAAFHE